MVDQVGSPLGHPISAISAVIVPSQYTPTVVD